MFLDQSWKDWRSMKGKKKHKYQCVFYTDLIALSVYAGLIKGEISLSEG